MEDSLGSIAIVAISTFLSCLGLMFGWRDKGDGIIPAAVTLISVIILFCSGATVVSIIIYHCAMTFKALT